MVREATLFYKLFFSSALENVFIYSRAFWMISFYCLPLAQRRTAKHPSGSAAMTSARPGNGQRSATFSFHPLPSLYLTRQPRFPAQSGDLAGRGLM